MYIAIVVVIVSVGLYWLLKPRLGGKRRNAGVRQLEVPELSIDAANDEHHPYQAVSLFTLGCGCPEVEALTQRRFLVGEAPALPLRECSSKHCNCKYVQHKDRRYDGHGRSVPIAADASLRELPSAIERRRRKARGRRKTDRVA